MDKNDILKSHEIYELSEDFCNLVKGLRRSALPLLVKSEYLEKEINFDEKKLNDLHLKTYKNFKKYHGIKYDIIKNLPEVNQIVFHPEVIESVKNFGLSN